MTNDLIHDPRPAPAAYRSAAPQRAGRRLLLSVALLAGLVPTVLQAAEGLNRIVLRVNDQILTLQDYETRKTGEVTAILADSQLSTRERQEKINAIGPQVMQDLFQELILLSRAKQSRILISDREVQDAIQRLRDERGIPDDATFVQALQASGFTLDGFREKMRRDMMMSEVVSREVTSEIKVGEEELRAYYRNHKEDFTTPEKRWLKEVIVLDSEDRSEAELERLAAEVLGKLRAGGEIDTVIAPYQEAGVSTGVIDLDWLRRDELDATLADIAFSLEPGAFSEPVTARGGLHILHLAGLEEAKLRPFEEVQDAILRRERAKRFDKAFRDYLAKLEANAYIQEDLPPDAVGFRTLASGYSSEEEIELFRSPELPPPAEEKGSKPAGGSSGTR